MERGITSLRRTFSQTGYYYALYIAALCVALALCWWVAVAAVELRPLEVRDYSLRECDFKANPTGPALRILDAVYIEELDSVINSWCDSAEIARFYGSLELRSVHRDHLDLRELYESNYDLILAKPELVGSGNQAGKDGIDFELIASYPDYGSQLVSMHGTPELTAQWMAGKTLGLLDDPNSVSAYQIPRAALNRAGLGETQKIMYFRSYRQMYQALYDGRIDVIPALLSHEGPDSALRLPPGLVLEAGIPGPAWYLDGDLLAEPVHCALLSALERMARNARVDYFRDLRIVRPCNAQ